MGNRGFHGFSSSQMRSSPGYWPASYPVQVSNLLMWLDAGAITGLNDDDPIASWPDNAGLATVAQSNNTYRPVYKTGIAAGRPVARFAFGKYMTIADFAPGANPTVMWVAYNGTQDALSSKHKPILAGITDPYVASTTSWGWGYLRQGSNGVSAVQSSGNNLTLTRTQSNAFEVYTFYKVSTTGYIAINQVDPLATGTSYNSVGGNPNGYWLGGQTSDASRRYTGDIAELLVWSTSLSAEERLYMQIALMGKYNIP